MMNENWVKSSYSQKGMDNCVECRGEERTVQVRDTQNRRLGHLSFSTSEWQAFLTEVRAERM
ncbi:uncharacterized protein DUF397 [Haloactinospora alba]|uniref:Uncharacterized protein DUF397 n=1 Tax=Haloactinospora alba TaxID=405555 RepID=A0A543NMZ0_9ACTN|nr:DUF397 domain-containing protein [Haloactinospora alba]TQN33191.1 uncharacterized protein DUF397 [Haloactinospora alba]